MDKHGDLLKRVATWLRAVKRNLGEIILDCINLDRFTTDFLKHLHTMKYNVSDLRDLRGAVSMLNVHDQIEVKLKDAASMMNTDTRGEAGALYCQRMRHNLVKLTADNCPPVCSQTVIMYSSAVEAMATSARQNETLLKAVLTEEKFDIITNTTLAATRTEDVGEVLKQLQPYGFGEPHEIFQNIQKSFEIPEKIFSR